MNKRDAMRTEVVYLIKNGVFNQNEIFNILYPNWNGHYSVLRDIISDVKNGGV